MTDRTEASKATICDSEQRHMARLIKQLGDSNTSRRTSSERALRSLGPNAVEPLLAACAKEARIRRCWQLFTVLLIGLIIEGKVWKYFHRGLEFNDFTAFGWILLYFTRLPSATERQRRLVLILSEMDDRRAIGPFADAVGFTYHKDWPVRYVARDALIRLLPQMQANDTALLTTKQRDALHQALRGEDKALILAILKAFEQIGDARDLPFVEQINSSDPQVMEAAQTCLPYLRSRIEQQQSRQTLLRASDAVSGTEDDLLRSASGAAHTELQILLRPLSNATEESL